LKQESAKINESMLNGADEISAWKIEEPQKEPQKVKKELSATHRSNANS